MLESSLEVPPHCQHKYILIHCNWLIQSTGD